MIDYKQELNDEQIRVVEEGEGPCLVLAGAGSGKTRTVTYRVAYLLEKGIAPEEMLLVTFTNKAAKEMVHRIAQLTGKEKALPWAGTFHHIAFRLLKLYAPLLGYKQNFTILDSGDSKDLMKLCVKEEGVDRKARRFPSAAVITSIISFARNSERALDEILEEKYPHWTPFAENIVRIASEYRRRKVLANAMDFDDLLVNLRELLSKSEQVRQKYANQFTYVMVDEYQDTNKVQASIIRLFASVHKNVLVVGDDAQSIYSFRAADIQNILNFEQQYPGAKIFRLSTNYRSTPEILAMANEVISNNVHQYEKELQAVKDTFVKPEVHAFSEQTEEAVFIADRILELREEGVSLNEMAVLFRAAFHSQALEVELVKRDIPYEFRGGTRFFERAHIKDALSFLRIVANAEDEVAWSRALTLQVGIGPTTMQKIVAMIRAQMSFEDITAKLSARAKIGWGDFLDVYNKLQEAEQTPSGLIGALLESKYIDYIETEYPDYRERVQDIEQFARFAAQEQDLTKFLGEITLQENFTLAQARTFDDEEEKLVLSTIHQAKGLEWQVVFVMHVSSGSFPSDRALKERNGIEEERRLFYVAVTRAQKQLYVSYPITTRRAMVMGGPSMFIEELPPSLIDHHHFGGSSIFVDPSDDVDDVVYVPEDSEPTFRFLKSIDEL